MGGGGALTFLVLGFRWVMVLLWVPFLLTCELTFVSPEIKKSGPPGSWIPIAFRRPILLFRVFSVFCPGLTMFFRDFLGALCILTEWVGLIPSFSVF